MKDSNGVQQSRRLECDSRVYLLLCVSMYTHSVLHDRASLDFHVKPFSDRENESEREIYTKPANTDAKMQGKSKSIHPSRQKQTRTAIRSRTQRVTSKNIQGIEKVKKGFMV